MVLEKRQKLTEKALELGNANLNSVIECISDPYWIDVFNNLTINRYTRGVYISNDCVYCTIRGKEFTIPLAGQPVDELSSILIKTFQDRLGVFSAADKKEREREMSISIKNDRSEQHADIKWKSVRTIEAKTEYLRNYVNALAIQYSLTRSQKSNVFNKLYFYLIDSSSRIFKASNIIFVDGAIDVIENMTYDNKRKIFIFKTEEGEAIRNVYINKMLKAKQVQEEADKDPVCTLVKGFYKSL